MINVNITQEMIERCYRFSSQIILEDNQYDRLPATLDVRIERTFVGKLAEYVFLNYLRSEGIDYNESDMFEIFEGQKNVDGYDFQTKNGRTVDIKSASKPFHTRIMVPIDQFDNIPKNYYVGIKIHSELSADGLININSIHSATIYGYCEYTYLKRFDTSNFGEGPCKAIQLNKLMDIERLVKMFK